MNALTFTLKNTLNFSVNCSVLTPNSLENKSITDIANIKVTYGNSTLLVSDLFEVTGSDSAHIVFKNPSNKMDYIGANMSSGKITIEGNAGAYLGFTMKSGEIHCTGSVESYAACNMVGGLLTIDANVGDFLGAGSEGLRKGMRGGTVIIKGNAGDRVGDQMRRGLILIEGNAGDYCGSRMIAGTIGVLGNVGAYTAFNMHRGTLLLKNTPSLHATVQDCGTHTLPYLSLLFKSFKKHNTPFSQLSSQRVQRFVGDAAYKGNGEILILNA
ncbi:MAG: formylmethanofuran dehydrogenase subunit C [Methylotenera sp.]|uniref:formylmethanofuran dehydrogenase subunit C n=1 Tax=Methylotenera sp. TaxID=2051956 RepID=UPI00271FA913|nr:formylmethanofuran dehydrogenase subunit C [Methylotenera sp.]MDO9151161.1 formylmethanofuran dehydrogenase subunit C [Methylotenera sp.]